MQQDQLITHLFRTESRKLTAVLVRLFGFEHIQIAEDIVADTFLMAHEKWGLNIPPNPAAWLYTVAKNKAKDHLKHQAVFTQKIAQNLKSKTAADEILIDFSEKSINDSQLQMMFAICQP